MVMDMNQVIKGKNGNKPAPKTVTSPPKRRVLESLTDIMVLPLSFHCPYLNMYLCKQKSTRMYCIQPNIKKEIEGGCSYKGNNFR
jgi:hypothetical protein